MSELNKRTGGGDGGEYEVITQTVTVRFNNEKFNATLPNPFGRTGGEILLFGGGAYGTGTMTIYSQSDGVCIRCSNTSKNSDVFYTKCIQSASVLTLQLERWSQYMPNYDYTLTLAFLMKK